MLHLWVLTHTGRHYEPESKTDRHPIQVSLPTLTASHSGAHANPDTCCGDTTLRQKKQTQGHAVGIVCCAHHQETTLVCTWLYRLALESCGPHRCCPCCKAKLFQELWDPSQAGPGPRGAEVLESWTHQQLGQGAGMGTEQRRPVAPCGLAGDEPPPPLAAHRASRNLSGSPAAKIRPPFRPMWRKEGGTQMSAWRPAQGHVLLSAALISPRSRSRLEVSPQLWGCTHSSDLGISGPRCVLESSHIRVGEVSGHPDALGDPDDVRCCNYF
uniref:Uncharacterized protein n=1 Tax=Nothoprocta perdicaria TaxID=30464 RepID=A0A8C6YTT1_NOTPE